MTPARKFVEVPDPLVAGWYLARYKFVFDGLAFEIARITRVPWLEAFQVVRCGMPDLFPLSDFTFLARIEAPELEI